jgi:hypothetical protein
MSNENQKVAIIPKDVQVQMKLEEIFTPQFRKKREDAYKISGPGDTEKYNRFVHYTTAEAALSIIQTKQMWMRKTTCMSDYLEVEHGFQILRKFFGEESKLDLFSKTLDACVPGAAQEAIQLFNGHLGNIRSSTYIASISEHNSEEDLHGRLSMWRAFSGDTGRVAIIFRVPWFAEELVEGMKALNVFFSPVVYLTEDDYHEEFNRILDNITTNHETLSSVDHSSIVNIVFNMFLICTVCLKHYGFREEQEWRAMYFPNLYNSTLMKSEIKVIGGVPQNIYKLPLDTTVAPTLAALDFSRMFDRLIIGPTQYSWAMYEAFSEALSNIGIQDAYKQICISNIPIRT